MALEGRLATGKNTEITLGTKGIFHSKKNIIDRQLDEFKVGAQVKNKDILVGVGFGGKNFRDIKLHARKFTKWGAIDGFVKAPKGNFRKGMYFGIGVTKAFKRSLLSPLFSFFIIL